MILQQPCRLWSKKEAGKTTCKPLSNDEKKALHQVYGISCTYYMCMPCSTLCHLFGTCIIGMVEIQYVWKRHNRYNFITCVSRYFPESVRSGVYWTAILFLLLFTLGNTVDAEIFMGVWFLLATITHENYPHEKLCPWKMSHMIMVHAHMLVLRRWHLHPLNGLPDPKGSLSSRRPSAAISEANRLVSETKKEETEKNVAKPYNKYSATVRIHAHKSFTHCSILNTCMLVDMVPTHRVSSDTRHLPHSAPFRTSKINNFCGG